MTTITPTHAQAIYGPQWATIVQIAEITSLTAAQRAELRSILDRYLYDEATTDVKIDLMVEATQWAADRIDRALLTHQRETADRALMATLTRPVASPDDATDAADRANREWLRAHLGRLTYLLSSLVAGPDTDANDVETPDHQALLTGDLLRVLTEGD